MTSRGFIKYYSMKRFYKVHEGFDLSGMSDTDYTDIFADIDDKEQRKHTAESILRSHILTGHGRETMPDFIWDDDCFHVDLKFPASHSFLHDNMNLYLFVDGVALAEIVQTGVSYTIDPLYRVTIKLTANGRGVGGNVDVDLTGCPERCGTLLVCINEPFKSFSFAGSPREVYGNFTVFNMWADVDDMTGGPDRITGSF